MHTTGDIPTTEPAEATAGDTWKWTKTLQHYDAAAGWVLSYVFVNATDKFLVTAAASGSDHAITVAASVSAGYEAGVYRWQSYATKGAERYKVDEGTLNVRENFAGIKGPFDDRSHARKVLEAIEAVIERRATKDQQSYQINGTSLIRTPIEQLLTLRDRYKNEVKAEESAERIRKGLGSGQKIRVRF